MTQTQTSQALRLSFEYFPTHSDPSAKALLETVRQHSRFAPEFASITFGAGGSTRDRTLETLNSLKTIDNLPLAGHLTTTGGSRETVLATAQTYRDMGVEHIVALRGDKPKSAKQFVPVEEGFQSSLELISALKEMNFEISVGAYPEKHPEALNEHADMDFLKEKFQRGADQAITQFFLEKNTFLRFRDRAEKIGIHAKLIPGILPIENFDKLVNFTKISQTHIPTWVQDAFSRAQSAEDRHLLSVALACEMIENLRSEGVDQFHIFTLNNSALTEDICTALGVKKKNPNVELVA